VASERSYQPSATIFHQSRLLTRVTQSWSFSAGANIPLQNKKKTGAPRSMKMGTIASPWRYDAGAHHALQSANLRRPAILRYAPPTAFPISQGGPRFPLGDPAS
jgi:hypothetical protein